MKVDSLTRRGRFHRTDEKAYSPADSSGAFFQPSVSRG